MTGSTARARAARPRALWCCRSSSGLRTPWRSSSRSRRGAPCLSSYLYAKACSDVPFDITRGQAKPRLTHAAKGSCIMTPLTRRPRPRAAQLRALRAEFPACRVTLAPPLASPSARPSLRTRCLVLATAVPQTPARVSRALLLDIDAGVPVPACVQACPCPFLERLWGGVSTCAP